jgi:UDP-N-acetylmuramyl tripeptide synthase
MGKLASEIADVAVFTAEDPRTEDVWSIIREMKEGVTKFDKVLSIPESTSYRVCCQENYSAWYYSSSTR